MPEGSRERAVPHGSGLRNYIKEETLAIHRDRGTNGNEIGESTKGTGIVALLLGMWLNYCHCDLI